MDWKLGNLLDDENESLKTRAKTFTEQVGLEKVDHLCTVDPFDPELPVHLLERLAPFFISGMLLRKNERGSPGWWVSDVIWRGIVFHLEGKDRMNASTLVPEITPLQIHKAPGAKILAHLKLEFLNLPPELDGFLIKPVPQVAYVLFSGLGTPWVAEHLKNAHRLVNQSFIY